MTHNKHKSQEHGLKYYEPSASVVEYLQRELQNLEPTHPNTRAGERRKFRRKKEERGKIAKDKKDTFSKIFQGFVDLVYFLEFIEDHQELHELYEGDLKDLFGINIDELDKDGKRQQQRKIWHWSLFVRFLSATLLNRSDTAKEFDFRIALAHVMIFQAIEAMRSRLISSGYDDEFKLFNSNVSNATLWSKLLAARYNDRQSQSRHRIRF